MPNKLTLSQRNARVCPDCGDDDPTDPGMHANTCRRIAMAAAGLQFGPPWNDWPDDLEPRNPRAVGH